MLLTRPCDLGYRVWKDSEDSDERFGMTDSEPVLKKKPYESLKGGGDNRSPRGV